MKRISIFILVLLVLFHVAGCSGYRNANEVKDKNNTELLEDIDTVKEFLNKSENNGHVGDISENIKNYSIELAEPVESIDDIICWSSHAVVAKLLSVEKISEYASIYRYEVLTDYLKNTDDIINVYYFTDDTLKMGSVYLMFLDSSDSPIFPTKRYGPAHDDFKAEIVGDKVVSQLNGKSLNYNLKDFESKITEGMKNNKFGIKLRKSDVKVLRNKDLSENVNYADLITKIKIIEEEPSHKYASEYNIKVLENVKGEGTISSNIILPVGLKVGKEYYILLKYDATDKAYKLFSDNYSAVDTTSYDGIELMNFIKSQR